MDKNGVFIYRTLEDLRAIADHAKLSESALILGGGLLGLEAAAAMAELGLETHLVECEDRLMPRQLDTAASRLVAEHLESAGVKSHLGTRTTTVLGDSQVRGVRFANGQRIDTNMVIVAAGIRPRDELGIAAKLQVAREGGIIVNDHLETSDCNIYAIGECARHRGVVYGLTTPGYEMASVLCANLTGGALDFMGADSSTFTHLSGMDVASLGDPFAEGESRRSVIYEDLVKGVYKKLVLTSDARRLLGGILVGDAARYDVLVELVRSQQELGVDPERLMFGPGPTAGDDLQETG
jgi:nitrite reductase (NADH) large subunit